MAWFAFKNDIDFMGMRRWFIGGSALVVLVAVIGMFYPGPRWGTDFVGGTEVEVALTTPVQAPQLREAISKAGFDDPEIVTVDGGIPNHFLVRVKEVSAFSDVQRRGLEDALCLEREGEPVKHGDACPEELRTTDVSFSPGGEKVTVRYKAGVCGEAQDKVKCPANAAIAQQLSSERVKKLGLSVAGLELATGRVNPLVTSERDKKVEFFFKSRGDQIMDGLRASLGATAVPERALRIEWIGPKAGRQLRDAAITSIALSLLFIMLYVALRFDIRFAPGGIIALIHDVIIAIGAMVLFQREVTLSTVAGALTIIGFSINDTVVIFDRIRENLGKYRKLSFPKIINRSITETLGRTIKTSTTTSIALLPFLFWGTGVIRDFAFMLLVGFAAGVYSTIFIASPLTEWIDRKMFSRTLDMRKRRVRRSTKDKDAVAPGDPVLGA
ncbi:MAG: protein translocase subunit SecF [Myxococcales bacterium]|nr:protein translocase subunit SecF [Myxococcales bacterium]